KGIAVYRSKPRPPLHTIIMKYLLFVVLAVWALCTTPSKPVATTTTPPGLQSASPVDQNAARTTFEPVAGKMNGLTFVAPPRQPTEDPMIAVNSIGANWIALVPYAFTRLGIPDVRYGTHGQQWWGESPEGVRQCIRMAHAAGLKVMLKPQVYIPRSWPGSLDFDSPQDWQQWEAAYEKYMLPMASLADSAGVDLFCVGTEFAIAVVKRPDFWHGLIRKVRDRYHGKITYCATWADYQQTPFWNDVDYIGLSAYFPLVSNATPNVDSLRQAWRPIREQLRACSEQYQKPILFTEFGYLSVDSAGWRNWELEDGIEERTINQLAQANCLEALFSTFQAEPWWAGGFLWKWFPNMQGHEGYPERDYTPQGKLGEGVLRKWYGK
ncbi:MAG: hypothetical protein ABIQ93_02470, partial [Saprospiraceae bacterium]